VEGLERRELLRSELEETLRLRKVLQPVQAEVDQLEARIEQVARRLREQDLTAMACAGDSCAAVDVHPHVVLFGEHGLAGVKAHAHPNRAGAERILAGLRGGNGVRGTREGDEEGVPLRVDLDAAVPLERFAECAPMLGEHVGVVLAELVQEPGRTLDVGEEEGDRSRRKLEPPHDSSVRRGTAESGRAIWPRPPR
jgi:hypothetical protein